VVEHSSPPAPSEAEPDPYAVLGVSPDAEDVVIRAAYRALMHKYTTPGRLPDDPVGDDARTRAVHGAYELLKDPEIRRAYDQHRRDQARVAIEAAPATLEPLVLNSDRVTRPPRPQQRRRRSAAPLLVGVLLVAALAVAGLMLGRKSLPLGNEFAPMGSVVAQPPKPVSLANTPERPLPCYVDGQSVGNLPLKDCATRKGVATGQLEAGLNGPPAQAGAPPTPPPPTPSEARTPTHRAPEVSPPVSPASDRPSVQEPDVDQSMATVRAFYEALTDDDGTRAASLVEPEKRETGPLSADRITRFYSALRSPLRLTSIYPLDPSTIFVRYQFGTASGQVCTGAANVTTTRRADQVLIRGIRAYSGC
jgi:DnaJ domain